MALQMERKGERVRLRSCRKQFTKSRELDILLLRFSFRFGDGVGLRTPDSTLWIAYTIDSVCASRYGCARAQSAHGGPDDKTKHADRLSP